LAIELLMTSTPHNRIHKLDLYRLAVQQPTAMVHWLCNAYASYHPGRWARHLREDFAGSSALAMAWVMHDHDHSALAVDNHGPTVRWAQARARRLAKAGLLDPDRLAFRLASVTDASIESQNDPPADLVVAMNFSINIYHHRPDLIAYFRHALQNLAPGGLLALDLYGGPGAQRVGTQRRRVNPNASPDVSSHAPNLLPAADPFEYQWEQADIDHLTSRVTCRIHFKTRGKWLKNAFVYDWRLWQAAELLEALAQAGFEASQVWSDPAPATQGQARVTPQGLFEPVDHIGPCEDFLAYITAMKPAAGR
jgi:hypothetical protein